MVWLRMANRCLSSRVCRRHRRRRHDGPLRPQSPRLVRQSTPSTDSHRRWLCLGRLRKPRQRNPNHVDRKSVSCRLPHRLHVHGSVAVFDQTGLVLRLPSAARQQPMLIRRLPRDARMVNDSTAASVRLARRRPSAALRLPMLIRRLNRGRTVVTTSAVIVRRFLRLPSVALRLPMSIRPATCRRQNSFWHCVRMRTKQQQTLRRNCVVVLVGMRKRRTFWITD